MCFPSRDPSLPLVTLTSMQSACWPWHLDFGEPGVWNRSIEVAIVGTSAAFSVGFRKCVESSRDASSRIDSPTLRVGRVNLCWQCLWLTHTTKTMTLDGKMGSFDCTTTTFHNLRSRLGCSPLQKVVWPLCAYPLHAGARSVVLSVRSAPFPCKTTGSKEQKKTSTSEIPGKNGSHNRQRLYPAAHPVPRQ